MSVADRLGLQDCDGALMSEARAAWQRWARERQDVAVVEDLVDLSEWALAEPTAANCVLGVLASITESEPEAITALVWALLPGAEQVARRLARSVERRVGEEGVRTGRSRWWPTNKK